MKRIFLLLSVVSVFLFSGCPNPSNTDPNSSQGDDSGKTDPDPGTTELETNVIFKNDSIFDVNVYRISPAYKTEPYFKVSADSNYSTKLPASSTASGDVFYFEYLIKVGDTVIPYFNIQNRKCYKDLYIKADEKKTLTIDELTECPSNSAYLLIENNTTSEIFLQNGMTYIYPFNSREYLITSNGGNAVYEVRKSDAGITFDNHSLVNIVSGVTKIGLPVTDFTAGTIYTISVTDDSVFAASLKTVTPFDIDVRNKIWSLDNAAISRKIDCVRSAGNPSDGLLVAGELFKNNKGENLNPGCFFINRLDIYGNITYEYIFGILQSSARPLHDANYDPIIDEETGKQKTKQYKVEREDTRILEVMETKDGSLLILVQLAYSEDNSDEMTLEHIVYKMNPDTNEANVIFSLFKIIGNNKELRFRQDGQNRIIESEENIFTIACGLYDYSFEDYDFSTLIPFICTIDCSGEKQVVRFNTNFKNSPLEGTESMFTSVFWNGSNYYVCGYEDADFQYSNQIHSGVIYKFSSDLNTFEKIYSKERYLFFCIDGFINGKYFVCGEEWGTIGNRLYGCYLSSDTVAGNENPKHYASVLNNNYCWFNQVCAYKDRIILCGQSAGTMAGTDKSSKAMVVCYNLDDIVQWDNHDYSYSTAYSCFENSIGTYDVFLANTYGSENQSIVSADLLGKDTGDKKTLY